MLHVQPADPFPRQLQHFIDVIRGRTPPLVTVEDALRTLKITRAINRIGAAAAVVRTGEKT